METPKTLLEAVRYFSDLDVCNEYMKGIKWPNGKIVCPKCGKDRVGEIKTRKMLRCKDCRKQFSYKVGTIFEDSPLGLDKWFVAVWCITNAKNGISSYELGRALGVTQKSAWHMLHRIRLAMHNETPKRLSGTVEADETYVGGHAKNMHASKRKEKIKGRGIVGKAIVQGVLERGGRVIAGVVPNTKRKTVQPNVREIVRPGATVYTDNFQSYVGLEDEYLHEAVDHSRGVYVRDNCHTNSMENFWSLLKRGIGGTYISVMPWHLFRYVDEQVFRFNERKGTDQSRFDAAMRKIMGKRLQYSELIS
jgi:transposase-like protein